MASSAAARCAGLALLSLLLPGEAFRKANMDVRDVPLVPPPPPPARMPLGPPPPPPSMGGLSLQPKGRSLWNNLTDAALQAGSQALNGYMQQQPQGGQPGQSPNYWDMIRNAAMTAGQSALTNYMSPQGPQQPGAQPNMTNALINNALAAGGNWLSNYAQPQQPAGNSPCNQSTRWWQGIGQGLGQFGLNAFNQFQNQFQQGNQSRTLLQRLRNASVAAYQSPLWQQQMAGQMQQMPQQVANALPRLDLNTLAGSLGVSAQTLGQLLGMQGGAQRLLDKLPPAARSLLCQFLQQQGMADGVQGCTAGAAGAGAGR